MAKIAILGAGGFGISLAVMADKYGHDVTVWSALKKEIEEISKTREQKAKLPGIKIPESIALTADISFITECDIVIIGVPTMFVRTIAKQIAPYVNEKMILVNTSKGLENETYLRMSEVIREEIPQARIVILSGPSHAEEVARNIPTTVAVASEDTDAAYYVQDILSNELFRIYINDDIIGCEIGGSLKNIIAICAGICDGIGYGDNTIAAIMTRGITEISRLGVAMGGKLETFFGLTGIGDLIVTCTSLHSRNRRAGKLIGEGVSPDEAVKIVGTVEGYYCCRAAFGLAKKMNIEMPITEQLYRLLFENASVTEPLKNLMSRPKRHETEQPLK